MENKLLNEDDLTDKILKEAKLLEQTDKEDHQSENEENIVDKADEIIEEPKNKQKIKKTKKLNKKILIPVLIVTGLVLIIGLLVGFKIYNDHQKAMKDALDTDLFYNGIYINDINLSGLSKQDGESKLKAIESSLRPDINLQISCDGKIYNLTKDNLSFDYNTQDVVDEAYNIGREGTLRQRYKEVKKLEDNPQKLSITCTLSDNTQQINDFVADIAQKTDVEAKSAYVSKFNPNSSNMFLFSDGQDGKKLNTDDLVNKIKDALAQQDYKAQITAQVDNIPKPSSANEPSLKDQTSLVSQFSTVSTNNDNANNNMKLALEAINGKTLKPGEVFSFNQTTGDTSNGSKGYLPAAAISDGEIIQEYGGGICQAATTVYGAALRADMKIVARTNHTYPSVYCPIGQDATVSYPSCDFKFKNSSDYPVFIKSFMSGKTLTVQIYGFHPTSWDNIEITSSSNADKTSATAAKNFYKNGAIIKTEAIASSNYKAK